MRIRRGFLFYFFSLVFFITPNLPMPTGAGPVAPILYIAVFTCFLILSNKIDFFPTRNIYFRYLLFFQFLLLLSDLLNIIMFDPKVEFLVLLVRIANIFIFILFTLLLFQKSKDDNFFKLSPFIEKIYFYSITFLCVILYGQAFGLINFGQFYRARTFFGIQLPFNKPLGLFELSDGKLGIAIAPLIFYCIINANKNIRFTKIKYAYFFALFFGFQIIIIQSRSAYLGLLVAFVLLIVLFDSYKSKIILISGVILSIILLLFTNIFKIIWIGLSGEGIYVQNIDSRGSTMIYSLNKFLESPIYGVGHSDLVLIKNPFIGTGVGSHNLFLDHLASGGLISFIPLLLVFFFFYYYSIKLYIISKKLKIGDQKGFSLWLITSMTYIVVELFFYRGLYNEYLYFFLALGVIAYLNYYILRNEEGIAYS